MVHLRIRGERAGRLVGGGERHPSPDQCRLHDALRTDPQALIAVRAVDSRRR